MSELNDQHDKPGSETSDPPADTDSNGGPSWRDKALCGLATVYLAGSLQAIPDRTPEQPSFPKDPPHGIASPAEKDRGGVIAPEDDGIDRREEAEKMTEGLTEDDKGEPI